jgi:ribosomal protein L40E
MKTITMTGTFAGLFYSAYVVYPYKVPRLDYQETVTITMIVNENHATLETDYSNNMVTGSFTIRDDRPDLSVATADIHVQRGGDDIQSETFGTEVAVVVTVKNLGGREATFKMRVNVSQGAYNYSIPTLSSYNISANTTDDTKEITVPWTIGQTVPGSYRIWVTLDPTNEISETNETNNLAPKSFTISQLHVTVSVVTDNTEYKAGKTMVLSVTITYENSNAIPVKFLPGVTFYLVDSHGNAITASTTEASTTDSDGGITRSLIIPLNLDTGQYTVNAMVAGLEYPTGATVSISSSVQGGLFPMWVWIVIIIAVVAVVAGFTIYTYVYGLGKLVECGECGAFIPAASKRCPKCGVEFEAGTMKCSECGAWIPADSTECPNCGVKFLGEVEDEADYMERMRKEYDEMVSKYREFAKVELGKKFSDREFEDWWRTQPGYITFDDWLAKEEEKKKEGPVPCPVCGTLNPKEATVCHKCGTVFAGATTQVPGRGPPPAGPAAVTPTPMQPEGAPQQQPPGAAPRMVIRRPIDRKVVPKKIIKTPLGEEKVEGGDETENQ